MKSLKKTSLSFALILLLIASHAQVTSSPDSLNEDDAAFTRVDREAFFPGGDAGWRKYIESNLNPAVPVERGAPVGLYTVVVQFVVDKNGSLADVTALTNMGYGMEAEVIRIIKKSGLWEPAMLDDHPVKAYRKQPVTFMVTGDDFEIKTDVPYVLYTGKNNPLTVTARKVKSDNIRLTITQGTITQAGDGKFIAKPSKPGRVIVSVYDTKKDKKIGDMSFEVKTP